MLNRTPTVERSSSQRLFSQYELSTRTQDLLYPHGTLPRSYLLDLTPSILVTRHRYLDYPSCYCEASSTATAPRRYP
ncbi:hypothetical protein PGT21_031548 [Puccinia graminis f. sp. tritici]|uniref:Uncharacterized protein n=1 Tax=Puccinia graminis f. sp. tritici TaxID=56615 RepID=A0A5B0QC27_PUCGR|nr:hypothetical protein PGT21_031548 [Puccinia graminis f. sp. tritici]